MAQRVIHLLGFVISGVSITAYVIALAIKTGATAVELREGMLLADSGFFALLVWIGSIGGFVCATIVATRTAWSFCSHGGSASVLNRKVV